jgi:ribonucleoside-diphosphate reductase alpha subunit
MDSNTTMYVLKRNGLEQEVSFDKVTRRLKNLCDQSPALTKINPIFIAQKVCTRIYNKVTTRELDELSAEICASLITDEYEYGTLASRIIISNNHKNTSPSLSETVYLLHSNKDHLGTSNPLVSNELYQIILNNKEKLNSILSYDRDYLIDYFGFKTLEKAYLFKVNGKIVERVQHLFMRVALGIHGDDVNAAIQTYDLMSNKYFIHATPTLFHSGTKCPQLLSCFLLGIEDSVDGIYKCMSDCAKISKWAGGIGLHVSNIRTKNSIIRSTNGKSNGIIPMLRVFNETARYINQSGKRNGSFAVYLEPWHYDIEKFLNLRKNHGDENERARDLFYALWMPDLFMKRVRDDLDWSLFCPDECPELNNTIGRKFEEQYQLYELDKRKVRKTVKARTIWQEILASQMETGTPYILYKDACNEKSNQQNLGIIKSSNLCTEIVEYSDHKEYACCTLASIGLPTFVEGNVVNYRKLLEVSKVITRNLDKIIDRNYYPIPETELSNQRHRPLGIGVQGLADVYMKLGYPFDSKEATLVNKEIFATIYYGAMSASVELAKEKGAYSTYSGSPISKGKFQFDLWNEEPLAKAGDIVFDWEQLRSKVKTIGVRNSLLLAPMPTASTSQILGNNECIEPYTTNIYVRRTLAGDFIVMNRYLMADLKRLNIWSTEMKERIIYHHGSIQNIDSIPDEIKLKYKTVWEMSQKNLIDQAADRGIYVCQSQSLNLFIEKPNMNKLSSMHMYSWKKGLKTGMYYLRTKGAAFAQQFTIDPNKFKEPEQEVCESCSG